jgi:hypothetical protein
VQLPEVRQRMNVVFLLEVSETQVKLNFTQLRTDAQNPLIDIDGFAVAMSFGVVRGSDASTLLKPASAAG